MPSEHSKIFTRPFQLVPGQPLPSPNRLRKKILIKNKRLRPEVEIRELELFRRGELAIEEEERDDPNADGATASPIAAAITGNATNNSSLAATGGANAGATDANASTAGTTPTTVTATQYQGSTLNVHPYLSSMVNYTTPMKFQGFEVAEEENCSFKMSSFAEATALGYLKQYAMELVNYNKRQLSRIYPKGARVDSSNFMPQVYKPRSFRMSFFFATCLSNARFSGIRAANSCL